MNHSKGNNHSSRIKCKHNGKWTVGNSVYISVKCFAAVVESSSFMFVGFSTKQMTLLATTSTILIFAVSRASFRKGITPPKLPQTFTVLHDITSQKTLIFPYRIMWRGEKRRIQGFGEKP